jgi:hypothetical protein
VKTFLLALQTAALAACGGYTTTVTDRQPFEPLPVYAEWWVATEACSGRSGDFARITWYTASSITGDQAIARGAWSPPHDIIIVRSYQDDELTVRHEMLHDLLDGDSNHESPLWETCDLIPG